MGSFYGYETTTQAMDNPIITNTLKGVLSETGNMLKCKYGFTESHMNLHINELIARYENEGMDDSLQRLSRDPIRKLGHGERIVGAILRCMECGIFPSEIIKVLFYTVNYMDLNDKSACRLSEILNEGGMEAVLTDICEIQRNDELFEAICKAYANFEYRKVGVLL
jgi:mannitol-1-phosphate 5-dehydrogenase